MCQNPDPECCGNCKRFAYEDAYGYGWCLTYDREMKCDQDACDAHEPETDQPE